MTYVGVQRTHSVDASGFLFDQTGAKRLTQYSFANATGTGNTELVAARTGMRIRVLAFFAVSTVSNVMHFQSNTTAKSPNLPFSPTGGISVPYSKQGWFQTAVGEALNFNQTVATATGVHVVWIEVP